MYMDLYVYKLYIYTHTHMFMMRYMYSVTPDILRVYFWGHINKNRILSWNVKHHEIPGSLIIVITFINLIVLPTNSITL